MRQQARWIGEQARDYLAPPERIAFWHIPKCAGMSLTAALLARYRLWRHLEPDGIVELRVEPLWYLEGQEGSTTFRRDLAVYSLQNPRTRILAGHFHLSATAMDFADQWRFVTILRDPVERVLSHYRYSQQVRTKRGREEESLDGWLASRPDVGNLQVRWLAHVPVNESVQTHHIDLALANLERFASVGFLEDLTPFLRALERLGGPRELPHRNTGRQAALGTHEAERVASACALDDVLYRSARSRFLSPR